MVTYINEVWAILRKLAPPEIMKISATKMNFKIITVSPRDNEPTAIQTILNVSIICT